MGCCSIRPISWEAANQFHCGRLGAGNLHSSRSRTCIRLRGRLNYRLVDCVCELHWDKYRFQWAERGGSRFGSCLRQDYIIDTFLVWVDIVNRDRDLTNISERDVLRQTSLAMPSSCKDIRAPPLPFLPPPPPPPSPVLQY